MIRVDHAGEFGAQRIYAGATCGSRRYGNRRSHPQDGAAGRRASGVVRKTDDRKARAPDGVASFMACSRFSARQRNGGAWRKSGDGLHGCGRGTIVEHYGKQIESLGTDEPTPAQADRENSAPTRRNIRISAKITEPKICPTIRFCARSSGRDRKPRSGCRNGCKKPTRKANRLCRSGKNGNMWFAGFAIMQRPFCLFDFRTKKTCRKKITRP